MIKYRPHRGSLQSSMEKMQVFNTIEEMFDYIVNTDSFHAIDKEDLSITEDLGKDDRIDWIETRYILTKRYGAEEFEYPQCIGMCSIE